jgi:hypothetical protein
LMVTIVRLYNLPVIHLRALGFYSACKISVFFPNNHPLLYQNSIINVSLWSKKAILSTFWFHLVSKLSHKHTISSLFLRLYIMRIACNANNKTTIITFKKTSK